MIVDIRDQLGNQLFTYAAIKSLCQKRDIPFSWFGTSSDIINSTDKTLGNTIDGGAFPNIDLSERIMPMDEPAYDWEEPAERSSNFLPELFEIDASSLIHGHFQTEKYFAWNRENVLKWFDLRPELLAASENKMQEIMQRFPNRKTVSIHLRRGPDYMSEGRLIDLDYYLLALDRILELSGLNKNQILALIFSDTEVERGFLKRLGCEYVISDGSLFDDLALMQLCDYHIISNSTFAWWGAWLDSKENTLICRPSIYPVSPVKNYPEDIFPDSWLNIPARRIYSPAKVFAYRLKNKLSSVKSRISGNSK